MWLTSSTHDKDSGEGSRTQESSCMIKAELGPGLQSDTGQKMRLQVQYQSPATFLHRDLFSPSTAYLNLAYVSYWQKTVN